MHYNLKIRLKFAHYNSWTSEEKKEFGPIPAEYWNYWSTRFPNLLIVTWRVWNNWNNSSCLSVIYI